MEFSNVSQGESETFQVTLDLQDNGSGADVSAGDGIYSAYFTDFKGAGRYGVKVIRLLTCEYPRPCMPQLKSMHSLYCRRRDDWVCFHRWPHSAKGLTLAPED